MFVSIVSTFALVALFFLCAHLITVCFIKLTRQTPYGQGEQYLQKGKWF